MKIVVLAGGTSTERDVSIVSGTGICQALRQKGHQAILVDVFCGLEPVDWANPFPAEYDVEKAAEAADCLIRIPMCGQVESLNAAMAAGILMYEASRQRRN